MLHAMSVDAKADRPLYKQLADALRAQIEDGEYPPGSRLPGEDALGRSHRVGRETVRQAVAILRNEGLVTTARGRGTIVRAPHRRTAVGVGRGRRIVARMPSSRERHQFGLDEGEPIFEIHQPDGHVERHPCNRVELAT
jgi:DNA-binding transcriptional regulator YhcF (GntR family)